MILLATSLLAADFQNLGEEVALVEKAGAPWLHLDIMDGHFVPNISFGPSVIKALRAQSKMFFDVHLMIEQPERYLVDFQKAGADLLTVHVETCPHLHRTIQMIKSMGIQAGVALNPHTPLESIEYVIENLDLVLLMTVNPGFGGQQFIPEVLPKIELLKKWSITRNPDLSIEVDGGLNLETAARAVQAGANVLVAGSAVFQSPDPAGVVQQFLKANL